MVERLNGSGSVKVKLPIPFFVVHKGGSPIKPTLTFDCTPLIGDTLRVGGCVITTYGFCHSTAGLSSLSSYCPVFYVMQAVLQLGNHLALSCTP